MELIDISKEIYRVSQRLDKAPKAIYEAAKEYAKYERDYRLALSMEIMKLKADGLPASLIADVARGNIAGYKFDRDLSEGQYKASIESSRVLQAELSGLQSMLKVTSDVPV